jgi:hypothetical protein
MLFCKKKPECLLIEVELKSVGALIVDLSYADKSLLWLMRFRLFKPIGIDIGKIHQAIETIPHFKDRLWLPADHTIVISISCSQQPTLQQVLEAVRHIASHLNLRCSQLTWSKLYAREP